MNRIPGYSFPIILFIFVSSSVLAQTNARPPVTDDNLYWNHYHRIDKPQELNLKRFCIRDQKGSIDFFLKGSISHFPQFTNDSTNPDKIKDLRKCLFPIDLNGDGLPDMIFSGIRAGGSNLTQIYINHKDSFELVFEDYQYISSMTLKDGHFSELTVCDPGSSGSWLYTIRHYRVNSGNMPLVFISGKQTADFLYSEKPLAINLAGKQGSSESDSSILRASASEINEPYNPDLGFSGNQIAVYNQKFRMTVIGNKEAKGEEPWCYIEVIPDIKPARSLFHETDEYPTFVRGWVKFRDIKLNP
jgi:hypothetical protein